MNALQGTNRIYAAAAFGVLGAMCAVLAFVPGGFWRTVAWAVLGVAVLIVVAAAFNIFYALYYVETGYVPGRSGSTAHLSAPQQDGLRSRFAFAGPSGMKPMLLMQDKPHS